MSAQFLPNPFTQRGAIRDPAQFFGRQAELNQIFSCIGKMQSVSVVGERRIGKSSLLHYVCQKGQSHAPRGARLVYLDVQRVRHEADFYTRLLEEVGSRGSTFRDLESTLRGKQVVVCLDEFEQVAGNEAFSESFFDGLRSLAQDSLALVTASQHSLFDLCRDKKFAGSQFWNIFHHRPLGLFTDSEARHFIQAQFTRAGMGVSDNEINQILQLAGRFPFFLQLACSHLFESRTGHAVQWERTFAQEAHDHLSALWEHLTLQEQSVLRWVLELGAPLPDDHVLEDLERRGLLVRENPGSDDWWVFSEAFAQIVQRPPQKTQNRSRGYS